MDILIGLVIAMFVITGAYVGYHASQQPIDEAGGHNITIELEVMNKNYESIQTFQKPDTPGLIH